MHPYAWVLFPDEKVYRRQHRYDGQCGRGSEEGRCRVTDVLDFLLTAHSNISPVGADRPGIVADVTSIVVDMGGNIGESRSQSLGGHFSSL